MPAPTQDQIDAYRRDGFLVVERFLEPDEVGRAREHFEQVFEHRFETGLAPDEVNYQPGRTPPDLTRQLCNVWKADRVLAAHHTAAQNAQFAAGLTGSGGYTGSRRTMRSGSRRPASPCCAHQDAADCEWLEPPNMTTCWMALDDTAADSGTIYYVRGSHHWPHAPAGRPASMHPTTGWGMCARPCRMGSSWSWWRSRCRPGGAAFHDGWTFHGSPPPERADTPSGGPSSAT